MVSALVNVGNLAKAEEAIRGFVATIGAEGIVQSEFNDARALFIKGLIDRYSSHSQIAGQFCALDSLELGFDFYDNMLLRVQSMSLDEVNSIAKKYFNTENMSRIRIGRVGVRR
jgi:predicted Zn-dependent peptidase